MVLQAHDILVVLTHTQHGPLLAGQPLPGSSGFALCVGRNDLIAVVHIVRFDGVHTRAVRAEEDEGGRRRRVTHRETPVVIGEYDGD
eukprot:46973-Eustigmatos_ZCMA.PRE.1